MKNLIITFILALFLFGCGNDGQDGRAYLSFYWNWTLYSYSDNNGNLPYYIYKNVDYEVTAGTYSYQYETDDGYYHNW